MLGNVVGVEAVAVESLDNLQSLLVMFAQWQVVAVEMVENTKFHFHCRRDLNRCLGANSSSSSPLHAP